MTRRAAVLAFLLAQLIRGWPAAANPPLQDLVRPTDWKELETGSRISRSLDSGGQPQLLPEVAAARQILLDLEALQPTVGVEMLALIDTRDADLQSPEGLLLLSNRLRAISTMKGLQYYSVSYGKMRTLFAESYVIDSPENRQRLPDPLLREVPVAERLFIYQKDLSFGENVHEVEYRCDGASLLMSIRNLQPIRFLLMPVVQARGALNVLLAIPQGSRVLLYGLSCLRMRNVVGLGRTQESVSNRMKALIGWTAEALGGKER